MSERRYSEEEVSAIIRQASGMQSADSLDAGLTLDEVKRLAGEVGVDPRHVENAALQLRSGLNSTPRKAGFQATSRFVAERVYDFEIGERQWEDLVGTLREETGSAGSGSSIGSINEWKGGSDFLTFEVSAKRRLGKTSLTLAIRRKNGFVLGSVFSILYGLVCLLLALVTWVQPLVAFVSISLVLIAAVYCFTKVALASLDRKHQEMLDKTMVALDRVLSNSSETGSESMERQEAPQPLQLFSQA